jgi:hypothetical protein
VLARSPRACGWRSNRRYDSHHSETSRPEGRESCSAWPSTASGFPTPTGFEVGRSKHDPHLQLEIDGLAAPLRVMIVYRLTFKLLLSPHLLLVALCVVQTMRESPGALLNAPCSQTHSTR